MIEHILILTFISIGICSTMWEGMILESLGDMIEETVGEFWAKPLGKCFVCFSFWFSIIVIIVLGWPWWYPVAVMGCSATISLMMPND